MLEATTGFEPVMGVLQVSPRRPSPSIAVRTGSKTAEYIPYECAFVRTRPLRLLSRLLSAKCI
jgi:hypothetical protein